MGEGRKNKEIAIKGRQEKGMAQSDHSFGEKETSRLRLRGICQKEVTKGITREGGSSKTGVRAPKPRKGGLSRARLESKNNSA